MNCPILIVFTNFLLITLINGLDCFTGRLGYGLMYTQCSPNINYCAKVTTIDLEYGLIIDKGCDVENLCSTIRSGCLYNSYDEVEICCCTSNLCNGSNFYFNYWIYLLIIAIIFIVLNL
ncbi:putative integral membrane protein [Acanthocheilonema viteae]